MPILNILKKRELVNVLVVVTRYFGGILLGTGGLVRAYSDATTNALELAKEITKEKGCIVETYLDYSNLSEFEHICEKNKINIVLKEYSDKIKVQIEISDKKYVELFRKEGNDFLQKLDAVIKETKYIENT